MPIERGPIVDTPAMQSTLSPRMAEQLAIAAAHQSVAGLNQADRAVAQIVRLPGTFGDAFGAEQNFRNHAVRATLDPCVQRTERERQSLPALRRELVERWARWTAVERPPKPASGIRSSVELVVKRQFDDVSRAGKWVLFQPKTMLSTPELQHGVPAVVCPPKLASR